MYTRPTEYVHKRSCMYGKDREHHRRWARDQGNYWSLVSERICNRHGCVVVGSAAAPSLLSSAIGVASVAGSGTMADMTALQRRGWCCGACCSARAGRSSRGSLAAVTALSGMRRRGCYTFSPLNTVSFPLETLIPSWRCTQKILSSVPGNPTRFQAHHWPCCGSRPGAPLGRELALF